MDFIIVFTLFWLLVAFIGIGKGVVHIVNTIRRRKFENRVRELATCTREVM